ncbi:hypothetical protein Glove_84g137 [Diversispora epigaea]|uniref:ATP-dependent DNA helicase n=1 Tax=Diversispora epigaea TaxID=1348612 RepID=A0A397J744_9GLOM|nr:hypothetical protein Glove_84g137 [Diversispora epigaea]
MKIPIRSEQELLGEFETYKDRFQVMFPTRYNQVTESLNKSYIEQRNCLSESYKIIDDQNVNKVIVQKETVYFNIDGKHASRKQFLLQNAFALTAHKVQGLTLPHVTTSVDESLFAKGQAYIVMSCATSWQNLYIINFNYNYLKSPRATLNEYKRLNVIHAKGFQNLQ